MNWETTTQPSASVGERKHFWAVSESSDSQQLRADIAEFIAKLVQVLREVYSGVEKNWDSVFFEIWIDGGRIIACPGDRSRRRNERATVQLRVPQFEIDLEVFAELAETAPDEFDRRFGALYDRIASTLVAATAELGTKEMLVRFVEWHPCALYYLEADDIKTMQEIKVSQ